MTEMRLTMTTKLRLWEKIVNKSVRRTLFDFSNVCPLFQRRNYRQFGNSRSFLN